MKIKKEFSIKGKRWSVQYKWNLREDGVLCDGLCDRKERVIYLRRELSIDDKWLTFLHELMHAVLWEAHVADEADGAIDLVNEGIICQAIPDVLNDLFNFRWRRAA